MKAWFQSAGKPSGGMQIKAWFQSEESLCELCRSRLGFSQKEAFVSPADQGLVSVRRKPSAAQGDW